MLSIVLFCPLVRLTRRHLAWAAFVACGLFAAGLPANADEPAQVAGAFVEQVRSLALEKASG
ncbi:MAG: hypothetical protein ABI364_06030, partial [Caldimonas sp.]